MKYINERILLELGVEWSELIEVISDATSLITKKEISQPIKPYLRFNNPANRIIAMPAFVGGRFNAVGIKWIASFPGNIEKSIKRAHSVVILNETETGRPSAIINTPLLSAIRTASVSGFVLNRYFDVNTPDLLNCGIIGFGPIGQLHLKMLEHCLAGKINSIYLYNLNGIDKVLLDQFQTRSRIIICDSWEEVYEQSKVFITCTVAKERYVNRAPKKGVVYLNVSLRDFHTTFLKDIDVNVVDNWEEVCRENTDIEKAHLDFGLSRDQVLELPDLLNSERLPNMSEKSFMFNPMGMAIYDIAVGKYYLDLANAQLNFIDLED